MNLYEGVWIKLISRETLLNEKNKYGDSLKASKRFFVSLFPFSYVLKDGLKPQTPQSKNSNFQALLEVSYCQDTSLFMDDLRSLNVPILILCDSELVDFLEGCSSTRGSYAMDYAIF